MQRGTRLFLDTVINKKMNMLRNPVNPNAKFQ